MRQKLKIPRIIKIEQLDGFKIQCMFNNGESRLLDFNKIFSDWNISSDDIEFKLLDLKEFKKVKLRNYTLSWPNIKIEIKDEEDKLEYYPYEIGPDVLYQLSKPVENENTKPGSLVKSARLKAGLTQDQLAMRSGTTRFYISRLENNKTDIELSTFRKIIEAGLGKRFKLIIE
ncbi:MAG: helix-turn-helix transcriptional regulator [Bacteroidales bacterium]|jgi:DNA-binding XRE family transcriptional regulator|nr:helix-turn-helix transcriptional regulator [Bacteroidales bacterium]